MTKQLLLFSLLTLVFFSCNENEPGPRLLLEGTYEAVLQDGEVNSINSMTFGKDGSLYVERFARIGSAAQLCLLNYQIGTYSIDGDQFTFNINESYGPDPLINYSGCPGKENLIPQLGSETLTVTGIFAISNTRAAFNLDYQCPELLPFMCLGSKVYKLTNP